MSHNHSGLREPWTDESGEGLHYTHNYYKIPHKDGPKARCGSPLSKDYLRNILDGTLRCVCNDGNLFSLLHRSQYPEAKRALDNGILCAYWSAAQQRIKSQFVVWEGTIDTSDLLRLGPPRQELPQATQMKPRDKQLGVILPKMCAAGTVTRRAVENTWLTGKLVHCWQT